ncbi:MAG TPA: zinc-binding dehydrogenase [Acidimicrobiales bacterium]|nr:zinc-binding dehydrogenase [Acidimicrobiales bacterium]
MRAATIVDGKLVVADRPDPTPGTGQLLVRTHAAGVNAADLAQVHGAYPAPTGSPSDIPGLEMAGEVVGVGPAVERFRTGDRVMAVVGGGAHAELLLLHERTALAVPDSVDWEQAGGFPEAFTTAHDALFTQCQLALGERLVVHGAAGGVGTAAVQLGVAAGTRVTATVRRPELRPAVAELGADVVGPEELSERGPFDVVLELVGGSNMAANLASLAIGGRISVIGMSAGASAEVNLATLMMLRARIYGSTLRARPLEAKADAARRVESQVVPLLAGGRLRVPIAARFTLEQVADAYDRFATPGKLGKVIIVMEG